jgi:ActR/RegA family two-component response regulator
MTDIKLISVDADAVKAAFAEAVKDEATKLLREAANMQDIRAAILAAFQKRWHGDKNTWIEDTARTALDQCMWRAVESAITEAGLQAMIESIVREHIAGPEFKEALTRRVIESVETTTFYVKPKPDDLNAK